MQELAGASLVSPHEPLTLWASFLGLLNSGYGPCMKAASRPAWGRTHSTVRMKTGQELPTPATPLGNLASHPRGSAEPQTVRQGHQHTHVAGPEKTRYAQEYAVDQIGFSLQQSTPNAVT